MTSNWVTILVADAMQPNWDGDHYLIAYYLQSRAAAAWVTFSA
jgi:hypothetical protein